MGVDPMALATARRHKGKLFKLAGCSVTHNWAALLGRFGVVSWQRV